MHILINISEEDYNVLHTVWESFTDTHVGRLLKAIYDGQPLPKGHGRLIDTNQGVEVQLYDDEHEEFIEQMMTIEEYLNRFTNGAITIIDADKDVENGNDN